MARLLQDWQRRRGSTGRAGESQPSDRSNNLTWQENSPETEETPAEGQEEPSGEREEDQAREEERNTRREDRSVLHDQEIIKAPPDSITDFKIINRNLLTSIEGIF